MKPLGAAYLLCPHLFLQSLQLLLQWQMVSIVQAWGIRAWG